MKQLNFVLLFSLILFSCGSNQKINFNININNTKEFLNNGDIIEFSIPNFSNSEIYDVAHDNKGQYIHNPSRKSGSFCRAHDEVSLFARLLTNGARPRGGFALGGRGRIAD